MRLGGLLRIYRRHRDMGVREMSKEIGLTPATLSRCERGFSMSGETLAIVLRWLLSEEKKRKC